MRFTFSRLQSNGWISEIFFNIPCVVIIVSKQCLFSDFSGISRPARSPVFFFFFNTTHARDILYMRNTIDDRRQMRKEEKIGSSRNLIKRGNKLVSLSFLCRVSIVYSYDQPKLYRTEIWTSDYWLGGPRSLPKWKRMFSQSLNDGFITTSQSQIDRVKRAKWTATGEKSNATKTDVTWKLMVEMSRNFDTCRLKSATIPKSYIVSEYIC